MTPAPYRKSVIPSEASRRLFFRVRSCDRRFRSGRKCVGLRREESLFDVPACSVRKSRVSSSSFSELCVLCVSAPLCVKSFSSSFSDYSLSTISLSTGSPMKSMILAAGLGTRLRPLTDTRPKALVEINGRTLLEITITRLATFGVTEFIVNVHHFADMVARLSPIQEKFRLPHRTLPRRRPTPRHRRRPKKSRLVLPRRFFPLTKPARREISSFPSLATRHSPLLFRTLLPPQRRRNQHHRPTRHAPIPQRPSRPSHPSRPIPRILPPTPLQQPSPTLRPPHQHSRRNRRSEPS